MNTRDSRNHPIPMTFIKANDPKLPYIMILSSGKILMVFSDA